MQHERLSKVRVPKDRRSGECIYELVHKRYRVPSAGETCTTLLYSQMDITNNSSDFTCTNHIPIQYNGGNYFHIFIYHSATNMMFFFTVIILVRDSWVEPQGRHCLVVLHLMNTSCAAKIKRIIWTLPTGVAVMGSEVLSMRLGGKSRILKNHNPQVRTGPWILLHHTAPITPWLICQVAFSWVVFSFYFVSFRQCFAILALATVLLKLHLYLNCCSAAFNLCST